MKKVNVFESIEKVESDPETGVGLFKLAEGSNMSFHLALIKEELKTHLHSERDEIYHVMEGEALLKVGEDVKKVKEGDVIYIPRRTIHGVKNIREGDLILLFVSAPPFDPEKDRKFV